MKLGIHAYAWCSKWTNDTLDLIDRVKRLAADGETEIILGTNPNMEGDGTAMHIQNLAAQFPAVQVTDRKSTRLNSSHEIPSRMPSSA